MKTRRHIAPILLASLLIGCSQPKFSEKQWRKQVESAKVEQLYEDHFIDGKYFNPWMKFDQKSIGQLFTWWLSSKQPYTDEEEAYLPAVRDNAREAIIQSKENDFFLWIGHDSFLIKTGDQIWLLDPMFSHRALLPARKTPPALTAADINELFSQVNVVISHNHYDHLDGDSIESLSENFHFYVPKGLKTTLRKWQPNAAITEMDWWEKARLANGYELHCLPAQHWSKRAFDGVNSSLWASYMIVTPRHKIYFGGDSGYFIGYREFGRKYPGIDYALLPITAYHPRWFMAQSHMNIEEALLAFHELKARRFIPTQWGTFRLGDNPPGYPILDLKRHIKEKNLDPDKFLIMDIGQLAIMK